MPKPVQTDSTPVTELFFALIRCGIGKDTELPQTPSTEEWQEIFDMAKKQTLVGIAFAGIEAIPQEQRPAKSILLQWYQLSQIIKKKNSELNRNCAAVSEKFRQEGFRNCILKGQGIAQLYPDPTLRTPGDIDIWLDGGCEKVLQYVRKFIPDCKPTYHHVDFPVHPNLEIEAHFTPSWTYSPCKNRRLQKYMKECSTAQFSNATTTPEGSFTAPTTEFNRIYILLHIYRHLFQEGIGLRQLLDYYFVLDQGFTAEELEDTTCKLRSLGLYKFAAATMYLLHTMLGLDKEKMLMKPDIRRGSFLLNEIMRAGNFGNHDTRYRIVDKENEFRHFINSLQRISRLISKYPSEVLWSPYFKTWHWFWRRKHRTKTKKLKTR